MVQQTMGLYTFDGENVAKPLAPLQNEMSEETD